MANELAVAYVSIVPETSRIAAGISKSVGAYGKQAEKDGSSLGSKLATGMKSTLKKSAIGVGVSAGAAIGAGLTKGIGRLSAIEMAEAKLRGLGNSAADVSTIMENANAAVKGTAYGLDEAATTAAMAVASGIKPGEELQQVLTTVADTAGIAGATMSEMGAIFGSVAARGKLQGDDLMQLTSRGIPVLQLLGEELGKTAAEVSEMVSKGQIDFKTFEAAMRAGVGGAAVEAGKTVRGAFSNMGAAAGRLGATLAGPFYSQAAGAFGGVTTALDALNAKAKPVMAAFGETMVSTVVPALQDFGREAQAAFTTLAASPAVTGALTQTKNALAAVVSAGKAVAPVVVNIAGAFAKATASLGVSTWSLLATTLEIVGKTVEALAGPLNTVAGFLNDHPVLVAAAIASWAGFKTIPGVLSPVKKVLTEHVESLKTVKNGVGDLRSYYAATGREIGRFGASMQLMATSSNTALQAVGQGYQKGSARITDFAVAQKTAGHSFVATTARMGAAATGLATGGLNVLKTGISGLTAALGGPWMVAIGAAVAVLANHRAAAASAAQAQEELARSVREGASAQKELGREVAGTTGKLSEEGLAAAAKIAKASLAELNAEGQKKLSWDEKIDRATVGVDELAAKIPLLMTETSKAQTQATSDAKQLRATYDALKDTANDLGYSMDDVNQIVAEGGPEFDKLVGNLRNSGDAGERAAELLSRTRDEVEAQINAARNLSPAFAEAADAVEKLADKSGNANDRLSALETVMQSLGLAPKNAEKAMMDAAAAVDEVVSSAEQGIDAAVGLGDALFDAAGKLDPTNANARELAGNLDTMRQALQKVAVNGGDTTEAFANMHDGLEALRTQFGLTESQMSALIEQYGLVPDTIDTLVNIDGADDARQELIAVRGALEDSSEVQVRLETDEAKARLEQMGLELKDLPDGNTRVIVNDEEAKTKLDTFITTDLASFNSQTATAHAVLEADGLFVTARMAAAQLHTLDLERPCPLANMDIGQLDAKQVAALQKVGLLDGETPTPAASMNIDQLTTDQQMALAKVFDLDSETPTPWASLTKDELDAKAKLASERLEELQRQKTEPKVDADVKTGLQKLKAVWDAIAKIPSSIKTVWNFFRNDHGNADGGVVGRAGGGRVPALATGGRLPVVGPGTRTQDGILGVDEGGMPTARVDRGEWVINRKSSARWHDLLDAINRDDPRLGEVARMIPRYANGGVVSADELRAFADGKLVRGVQANRPLTGAPYVWGGTNWGDCSGAMSALARFAVGLAPFGGRFSTATEGAALSGMGFMPGMGGQGDFSIGWFNGGLFGGHTAGTLPDGTHVEMGGGNNGGAVGGGAVGADDPQFTDCMHLPLGSWVGETSFEYGNAGYSGEGDADYAPLSASGSRAADELDSASDGALSQGDNPFLSSSTWSSMSGSVVEKLVSGQVQDLLGVFGIPDELPPVIKAGQQWVQQVGESTKYTLAQGEKLLKDSVAKLRGVQPTSDTSETTGGASAGSAAGSPQDAVRTAAASRGWDTGDQWEALSFIVDHESGWDPTAVNPTSGAYGLFQFLGATRATYLPDSNPDPAVQAEAGMRYIADRYGTPMAAREFWESNGWYDRGGIARGVGHMLKNTLKPERVLSPEQTKAFNDLVFNQLPAMQDMATRAQSLMQRNSDEAPPTEGAEAKDAGSLEKMIGGAIPALLNANSLSELAGQVVAGAVRTGGRTLTGLASGVVSLGADAAQAGLGSVAGVIPQFAGMIPGVGAPLGAAAGNLTALSPLIGASGNLAAGGINIAGDMATEVAAWYAGNVASGVVGAFEQYAQEMIGLSPLSALQDAFKVIQPRVEQARGLATAGVEGLAAAGVDIPTPVCSMVTGGGDVYNFNALNPDQMFSMYRREVAKQQKGLIGAR